MSECEQAFFVLVVASNIFICMCVCVCVSKCWSILEAVPSSMNTHFIQPVEDVILILCVVVVKDLNWYEKIREETILSEAEESKERKTITENTES